MRALAFDTETALIRPGVQAPELACVSFQIEAGGEPEVLDWRVAHDTVKGWLLDPGLLLVGHNIAFDMAVLAAMWPDLLPLIFAAYEADRVTDTMLRQQLIDIASGCYRGGSNGQGVWIAHNYDLDSVCARNLGHRLDKDTWRLKYGGLRETPIEQWPEGARTYPKEDARATLGCYLQQTKHEQYIPSQFHEARAAFWQRLMSIWGLRTSITGVLQLKEATEHEIEAVKARLIEAGLVRPNGKRNTKAAMARMEAVCAGREIARTPTGQPKLDEVACKDSEDPLLIDYSAYTTLSKVLSTDVPLLAQGLVTPIHPRLDIAETGRATCSKPNVQNLRRLPGVREAFVPRPGMVFIDSDYPQLELWALAQVQLNLFGHSELASVLTSGKDPHTALAADILGISYEEAVRRNKDKQDHEFQTARSSQGAKGANFGFPGGLGPKKFVAFSKSGGIQISLERAEMLRKAWFKRWPEMTDYFAHITALTSNPEELATITLPVTGMIRGGARFCAAANTYFQGLGAAATKCSGWLIAKACYIDTASPLYGSRPVAVIHDQFIVETPEGPGMHAAAMEVGRLMQEGARMVMPDCVPNPMDPVLCRFWSKEAKAVKNERGELVPWPKAA